MYISHKYKFIFLRTPKTASSSLSEFLIKNVDDPQAVYTEVDDTKIAGTLDKSIVNKYRKDFKYFHFTLEDLVKENIITPQQIKNYKCFAVLRDPIDRQKSFYYFYKKWRKECKNVPASLEEYKRMAPEGYFLREPNSEILQSSFLEYNGQLCGEYWLYENIDEELDRFVKEYGIQVKHPLPKHKTKFRTNRENEINFDYQSLQKMKNIFEKDFNLYTKVKTNHVKTNQSLYIED